MSRILAAEILFSLAIFAMQEVPRGHGILSLAALAVIAALVPLLLAGARTVRERPGPQADTVVTGAIFVLIAAQITFAIVRMVKPKVIDIGMTTLAAVMAVSQGGNPYGLPIDPLGGGLVAAADGFDGYKYLPVMLAAYAPACLALGIRGIVLTNLVLQLATAAAIRALAARDGGRWAGNVAAGLYLSLPFAAFQLSRGANDLVAVLPLLLALPLVERRPGWAGLLVGLSIAAKLMPGLAILACLMPPAGGRRRYVVGIVVGLVPILPFAVASPHAFAANILLFVAERPIDDTSWLYLLPPIAATAARAAAALALLGLYGWVWHRPPGLDARVAAALIAILVVLAVGPDLHHNYYLWFIPPLAALAGRAALGAGVERR